VTGLAVVPVKVKAPRQVLALETYAFLDSGSNSSFCSEDLAHQLGLSGQQTTLALTSMEKENSRAESHIVRLEVLDLEEENLVELPMVFIRPKLPVSADNAANQEDIDRGPHLAGIKTPRIDAGVGLLIGSHAPEVLEPKRDQTEPKWWPSCNENRLRMGPKVMLFVLPISSRLTWNSVNSFAATAIWSSVIPSMVVNPPCHKKTSVRWIS